MSNCCTLWGTLHCHEAFHQLPLCAEQTKGLQLFFICLPCQILHDFCSPPLDILSFLTVVPKTAPSIQGKPIPVHCRARQSLPLKLSFPRASRTFSFLYRSQTSPMVHRRLVFTLRLGSPKPFLLIREMSRQSETRTLETMTLRNKGQHLCVIGINNLSPVQKARLLFLEKLSSFSGSASCYGTYMSKCKEYFLYVTFISHWK